MIGHDPRTAVRMPRYLGGKIEFNNRQSVIDCVVRNQSRDGALLRIETPVELPAAFDLHITKTDRQYACELVWNASKQAGVQFRSEPGSRHKPYLRPVA